MTKKFLLLLILLSSCTAYHHGTISEAGKLGENEKTVDIAHGFAKVNRFLFFGGISRDALIADAKKNLILNTPLEKGQYFANYVVDFKETFYFPAGHITKAIITADVIGANDSDYMTKLMENEELVYNGFHLGQTVNVIDISNHSISEAKILAFKNQNAVIGYYDKQQQFRTKKVSISKLKKQE